MAQIRALTLADVDFGPRMPITAHARYRDFAPLIGSERFEDYQEVFERGFVETSLMCGDLVRLDNLHVGQPAPSDSPLERLLGPYPHWRRIGLVVELLAQYEQLGCSDFSAHALDSGYAGILRAQFKATLRDRGLMATLRGRWSIDRRIQSRVEQLLALYDNMKKFGGLVGDARVVHDAPVPLQAADVPWAIDYPGYLRLREGSHRRAVAISLGWETLPTLVFEFSRVRREELESFHPYLAERFEWFRERVIHGS